MVPKIKAIAKLMSSKLRKIKIFFLCQIIAINNLDSRILQRDALLKTNGSVPMPINVTSLKY